MKKKKKHAQKAVGWATAHLSHGTMDCSVTQGSWALLQEPRYGQATPTTRRGEATIQTTTRLACEPGVQQRLPAHGLAKGSRDTKHCIVAEGRLLCHDTA